jgi:hypothetical protein
LAISRRASRSRRAWRLSWSFLPRASPSSTFARPFLKYRRRGTMVNPRSATFPMRRAISRRWSRSLRVRSASWLASEPW